MLEAGTEKVFVSSKSSFQGHPPSIVFPQLVCPGCKACQLRTCSSSADCLTLPEEKMDLHNAKSVQRGCLRKLLSSLSSSMHVAGKPYLGDLH